MGKAKAFLFRKARCLQLGETATGYSDSPSFSILLLYKILLQSILWCTKKSTLKELPQATATASLGPRMVDSILGAKFRMAV